MAMKRFFILLFVVFLHAVGYSQLVVTRSADFPPNWTPDSLVRNVLLGPGEEVFNVKYNGDSTATRMCNALGMFTTDRNSTNLGIRRGIIMSTGHVGNAIGPNISGSIGSDLMECNSYVDPALKTISSKHMYNASTLEFDFIPKSNTITFRYVFASEEYPEFAGGSFNDVFGFFISGPRPTGGVYQDANIALVPNTNFPISVNTINDDENSQYYVDNTNGTTIQYDGFTTVFTARASVIPCQTYHLKMSITDITDNWYDSAVFIEAESFTSNTIMTNFNNPTSWGDPLEIHEGCYGVDVIFTRPNPETENKLIPITILGTASNGQDYQPISSSIAFPAADTMVTFRVQPIYDGIEEGVETITIVYQSNECETDTINITLYDYTPMQPTISFVQPTSDDVSVELTAVVTGGYTDQYVGYSYTWSNDDVFRQITVPVTESLVKYWYTVRDKCMVAYSDTVLIGKLSEFAAVTNRVTVCVGHEATLRVDGGDWQVWSTGDSTNTISFVPTQDTMLTVTSYKWWNDVLWEDVDTVYVTFKDRPVAAIMADPETVDIFDKTTVLTDVSTLSVFREWCVEGTYMYDKVLNYSVHDPDSAVVRLVAYSDSTCSDTTYKTIYVKKEDIWIPNSFTPDANSNNYFELKARNLASYSICIYNRWGNLVFESNSIDHSWDGTYKNQICNKGSYAYIVRYSFADTPSQIKTRTGTLLLIR